LFQKNNSHTKEHELWNPIPQNICMHLTQFLHGKPIKKISDLENLLIIPCIPYSWTFHQKHLWLNKTRSQGQISKWTHIDQLNRNFLWLNIECVLDYIHQLIRDYLGSISGLYCKFQNKHILISSTETFCGSILSVSLTIFISLSEIIWAQYLVYIANFKMDTYWSVEHKLSVAQ